MKYFIISFLLSYCCFGISLAQTPEFIFPLYFEDGAGNRDTVFVGYSSGATDSIDTIYGEIDISDIPFNTDFEVRVTTVAAQDNRSFKPNSKIMISGRVCEDGNEIRESYQIINISHIITIRITTHPLKINWDPSLFDSLSFPCHQASFIAPSAIATQYPYPLLLEGVNVRMSADSTHTIDLPTMASFYEGSVEGSATARIYYIWFVFQNQFDVNVSTEHSLGNSSSWFYDSQKESLEISPDIQKLDWELSIFDVAGRIHRSRTLNINKEHSVNVSSLPKGLYFFSVSTKGTQQLILSGKFIK